MQEKELSPKKSLLPQDPQMKGMEKREDMEKQKDGQDNSVNYFDSAGKSKEAEDKTADAGWLYQKEK